MKFTISTILLAIAGFVASANIPAIVCSEADRFGVISISPSGKPFNAGDNISIHIDFTCAITHSGIVPKFLDYTIEVPAPLNNGFEPTISLARRTLSPGATVDSFTTKIPHEFFTAGAPYSVVLTDTYPINGTDGSEVLREGGVLASITINV
ncbi:hypothetical protein CVT25_012649 [Psilocybe cyanescens]|uniref:Phosphatidylglycerol/phosphatidylinositol transfer protein n=1 Tax=Psilocybe cyanescens TaxID=93625 RepID=A0A409XLF0_PSICY|nr:hypothetical protein CVT25_012649 [Psilocybe cyanescens]